MDTRELILNRKYSVHIRRMIRQYRPSGLQLYGGTNMKFAYLVGRHEFTDRLVRRLVTIGAATLE